MENIETPKKVEIENESPENENRDEDEKDKDMVEVKPLIDIHLERDMTKKKEALEKYCLRAVLARDARQTQGRDPRAEKLVRTDQVIWSAITQSLSLRPISF